MENPPLEDPKNGGHGVLLRLPDGLEVCVGLRGRFQAEAAGGGLGHVFPALDLLEVPGVRSAGLVRCWDHPVGGFTVNKQFAIENGHRNSGFSH